MKFNNPSLNLNYFLLISKSSNEISFDPTLSLLKTKDEFDLVLRGETNYDNYISYIYYNRKNIFDILFDEENNINIASILNKDINNPKFESFLYYLCLLLEENKDMVYITYPAEFIKKISIDFLKDKNNENIYTKIIKAKINLELINNYISGDYLNSNRDLLIKKNDIENTLQKNLEKLQEIKLNISFEEVIMKNLDDIYFDIIKSILNLDSRDKYDKALNILTQMNLDIIDIMNGNMFHKMKMALKEKNFKRKYLIETIEDFNDKNKINMYFILLKYIFKNSLYIYQISFLSTAREVLLRNLRRNNQQFLNNKITNLIFVVKRLLDSEYYIDKYIKNKVEEEIEKEEEIIEKNKIKDEVYDDINNEEKNIDEINEVLTYYKNYKNETKKEDIIRIENALRNKEKINFREYLKDLDEAKYLNPRYSIIEFFYLNNNKNKPITEKNFQKEVTSFKKKEKPLIDNALNKMVASKTFFEYFKKPENTEQVIKLYSKDIYNSLMTYSKLKEVLNYFNHYLFESKAQDIEIIEKIIADKSFNDEKTETYLEYYEVAEKKNLRYQIIYKLAKEGNNKDKITEEILDDISYKWNNHLEPSINNKSSDYSSFGKDLLVTLSEFFKNKDKEEYLLKIFDLDCIEFFRSLDFDKRDIAIPVKNIIKEEETKNENKKEEIVNVSNSLSDIDQSKEINIDDMSLLEETDFKTKVSKYININKDKINLNEYSENEKLLIFDIFIGKNQNINEIKPEKIESITNKYSTLKKIIKERKKNKLNRTLINEAYDYFINENNKETLLKTFNQDDINHLLSLKAGKNKKPMNQLEPEIIKQLEEVKKYYLNFYPEQKEDINKIEQILIEQNKNDEKLNEYLNKYDEAKDLNLRFPFIQYLFEIKKKERNAKSISEAIASWKICEKMIKENRVNKMKEKKNLKIFFKNEENKNVISSVFTEEEINNFINGDNKNKNKEEKEKPKEKLNEEVINNLKIVLNCYKKYFFESKKEDIELLEKNIELGEKFEYEKYLTDLKKSIEMNDRYPIIKFIFEKNNKGNEMTEKELQKILKSFESSERPIKDGKKSKIKSQIKNPIIEYFNNEENANILLKIFTQEQIDQYKEEKKVQKISNENINKLKEILEYYNNYYFETKTNEINELNDILRNEQGDYEKYLKDEKEYEEAKKMNIRYPIICVIYEQQNKTKDKNEKQFDKSVNSWNTAEGMIKRKKCKKMHMTTKNILLKYFNDENNKEYLLQIFEQDEYEFFKNEDNNKNEKIKEKLSEEIIKELKIVLNYYEHYKFESKKDDIIFLENGIQKEEEFEYKNYLVNLKEYEDMNNKYPIIEFLLKKENKEKTENELSNYLKSFNTDVKVIKDGRLNKFKKGRKNQLFEYFNNNDNREKLLKIFAPEQINNFINHNKKDKNEKEKEKIIEEPIKQEKDKISTENINKLKEILDYYNNYKFESKKQEIIDLNEIIQNEQGDYRKYLKDEKEFEEAKKMNIRYPIICVIYEQQNKTKDKNEKQFDKSVNSWNTAEGMIKRKKCKKMHMTTKNILLKYFNDENNKEYLLQIFEQDEYEFFKNEDNNKNEKIKEKLSEEIISKLKIVLNYYKNYLFKTKEQQIISLEQAINKGEEFDYKEYLENFEEMKNANYRYPIVEFLFEKEKGKNKEKTEDELIKLLSNFNKDEGLIKDGKKNKFNKNRKIQLLEYFNNNDNRKILLKIFTPEQINNFIEQNKKEEKKEKISAENINKLKEILNYYNNYLFQSKSKEIAELNDIINNKQGNYEEYLKEFEKAQHMNIRYPLICLLSDNNNTIIKNEEKLSKNISSWNSFESMIKGKKFKKMYNEKREVLLNYFNNEENRELLLKIFEKEVYEYFKDEKNHPKKKKKISEEDKNNLSIVLNYYINYCFESKKEDIKLIEKALKNENVDYQKFLNDLELSKKMIEKYPIIEYLKNATNNIDINKETENELNELVNKFEKIEKIIKERNNEEIPSNLKKVESILLDYFKDEEKSKEQVLFTEEDIKFFLSKEVINKENIDKLEIVLEYYQNYFFESKINEIENLKEIIKNKKGNYKKYLSDFETADYFNYRNPLINCLIENKNKKTERDFSEAMEQWKENEKMINLKNSLNKMKKRKMLFQYLLKDEENQKILFNIFEKDKVDNLLKIFNEYKKKIETKNKLKEVLLYYKVFRPDSKRDDIIILEKLIKKGLEPGYERYLVDYEESKKMNKQSEIVKYLCGPDNKSELKVKKNLEFLDTFQHLMKDGRLKKLKNGHKRLLLNYMQKEENGEISNKYFTKEQIDLLKGKS